MKVQERGREVWKEGMSEKSSLEWYARKDEPRSECFYDGSRSGELLFKARTQSLEVNSRTYRWENDGDKTCKMCDSGRDETIEHVLLECEKYERERRSMIEDVKEEIGSELWESMVQEGEGINPTRVVLFLLGLSTEDEWNSTTVERVKAFLESMWTERSHR